jgi:hypothetical protein
MTCYFHFQRCGATADANEKSAAELAPSEAKQYGELHVHVANLKLPKVVRNVGYGLSDTR